MKRGLGTVVCAGLVLGLLNGTTAWADPAGGGTPRWTAAFSEGIPSETFGVGVTPDGGTAVVTGSIGGPEARHIATLAYDAGTGAEKWTAEYPSADQTDRYAQGDALAVSPDGSAVYVGGRTSCIRQCDDSSFEGWVIVAYDVTTGDRLWVAKLAGGGDPQTVTTSPDGSQVFVTGTADVGSRVATVAYDAGTGEEQWVARADNWNGGDGAALAVSPDGSRVYAISTVPEDHVTCFYGGGYRTTAYDTSDGSPVWSVDYQVVPHDDCGLPSDIGISPDGSTVYVTGTGGPRDDEFYYNEADTVAYDTATGDQLWVTKDAAYREGNGDHSGPVLDVDPGGAQVYVAGDSCTTIRFCTAVVMAYDASTGVRNWLSRYDGGGRGYVADLSLSPDGTSLFFTGQWTMPCFAGCTVSGVDAPLVAYDTATGDERWATTYHDNYGEALVVSADNRSVYLAGSFTGAAVTSRTKNCAGQCGYATVRFNVGPGAGTFQDSTSAMTYDGWRSFYDKTAFGGAYRASRVAGAVAKYRTPRATSVSLLAHAGPDQGMARLFVDGDDQGVFDLYAAQPAAHRIRFDGLAQTHHTVKVKVLGRKSATSTDTWVGLDAFRFHAGMGIAEESSPKVHYDSWNGHTRKTASGGSYRVTRSPHARVSLDFTGRRLTLVTAWGPHFGKAHVVIDGDRTNVDLFSPRAYRRVPYTFSHLGTGTHHVTIRPLSTSHSHVNSCTIVVDALVVHRH